MRRGFSPTARRTLKSLEQFLVPADELLCPFPRLLIGELHRRRLHEVAGRSDERPGNLAVECDLRAANGVDDDAGRIRRVPYFELQLAAERHLPESRAFHPDIAAFSIAQPWHVIARPDMHIFGR